jgi:hypothetical protein
MDPAPNKLILVMPSNDELKVAIDPLLYDIEEAPAPDLVNPIFKTSEI